MDRSCPEDSKNVWHLYKSHGTGNNIYNPIYGVGIKKQLLILNMVRWIDLALMISKMYGTCIKV